MKTAGVSRQRTVMTDNSMARDYDSNGIIVIGHSDSSCGSGFAE
jgi:hypothetical protein